MGLLKSIDSVPGIDYYDYRDNDYYNKYCYRARFSIVGVRYTWYVTSADEYFERLQGRGWYSMKSKDKDAIQQNKDIITNFINWRNKVKKLKTCTIRIEGNSIAVFSNDLTFLKSIENEIPNITLDYTQVQKAPFFGVKYFVRKPKHKFRVYLKPIRVEADSIVRLKDVVQKTKKIYPSSALRFWCANALNNQSSYKFRWLSANHFIDYDDEQNISYLALVLDNILGKRYKLEQRPEEI